MSNRGADWFKCFPTDFLMGTEGMKPEEVGVYTHLLMRIYQAGGEARRNDRSVAGAMAVSTQKIRAITERLIEAGKIIEDGENLTNSRAKVVAKSRESLSEVRAKSGRAGGIASGQRRKKSSEINEAAEANASSKTNQRREEKRREESPPLPPKGDGDLLGDADGQTLKEAVSAFNEQAKRVGWPQCQKMTPQRRKAILARVSDAGGLDGWRKAMIRAAASDFLAGRTANPWTGFGIDWIARPANFTKLLEGNYDNKRRSAPVAPVRTLEERFGT